MKKYIVKAALVYAVILAAQLYFGFGHAAQIACTLAAYIAGQIFFKATGEMSLLFINQRQNMRIVYGLCAVSILAVFYALINGLLYWINTLNSI